MTDDRTGPRRDRSLDDARRALERMAPVVRFGLLAVGLAVALGQVRPLLADAQFTWGERRVIGAVTLVTLGGFALAGWAAGRLLGAAAGIVGAVADASEAATRSARLIESRLAPSLDRAVAALERLASGSADDPSNAQVVEVRRAIREGRWGRAERLLEAFGRDHPHSPDLTTLGAELAAHRESEAGSLQTRLDDALAADDPATAITCRDALTRHVAGPELAVLDSRLARWLARWVRGRSRARSVTPEVAAVAALGADRFGDSDEGRALRDAVPGLRRRAGLCPACARPYRGPDGTCPECAEDLAHRPANGGAQPRGSR
jgi:hypothetical protein